MRNWLKGSFASGLSFHRLNRSLRHEQRSLEAYVSRNRLSRDNNETLSFFLPRIAFQRLRRFLANRQFTEVVCHLPLLRWLAPAMVLVGRPRDHKNEIQSLAGLMPTIEHWMVGNMGTFLAFMQHRQGRVIVSPVVMLQHTRTWTRILVCSIAWPLKKKCLKHWNGEFFSPGG